MSRFQAVSHEDRAEINLSPMLDVVFIMLIFFVVVAAFINEHGLAVALPGESGETPPDVDAITVRIEAPGTFNVNGRVMSRASVTPYVQALRGESPDADFAVMAADGVLIKDTVAAVEAGRGIGIDVVTILPMSD